MTFLFDIGKVLLDFHFEPSLATLLPPGTPDAEQRLTVLLEKKDDFEAGRIETADYIPWALERLGSEVSEEAFRHAWQNIFTPNLAMWRVVESLSAAGHRLILFSNTNGIHCPWIFENYDVFRHFPEAVLSFETGAIKPEPEIYRHAIDRHDLVPSETLYIDDLPANIDAGRQHGFRCWQYDLDDHPAFERWLSAELMER
ncbi:HAD family hydrolase [Luteolibacter marinus]|uniref:HAD family hydrolase n=1 Tax=Luteolibacter marinus TaxID=2776705 RepID=UPI001865DDDB|nr:HAD family phosphatase [Luteolibacter marinus]